MLDLVVLTPDKTIPAAINGILQQPKKIGINPLNVKFINAPDRGDGGVFNNAERLLKHYTDLSTHALVVLDATWGGEPTGGADVIETIIEQKLETLWDDKARCIAIDPEIEAWLWSESPHVAQTLGWDSSRSLREWLIQVGLLQQNAPKPSDPKEAYLRALREKKVKANSSSHFYKLAEKVSYRKCKDRAFNKLLNTLREWFPKTKT